MERVAVVERERGVERWRRGQRTKRGACRVRVIPNVPPRNNKTTTAH